MANIAVMLTAFRRTHLLNQQIAAIEKQTVPPTSITVWNGSRAPLALPSGVREVGVARQNLGVWTRFMEAGNLDCEAVAVFDDDATPGPRWLENCLRTAALTGPGVLGACGVSFINGERQNRTYPGWKTPSHHIVQCDLVGHAWFVPKPVLDNWHDAPYLQFPFCGEDYWLSVQAQKHGWKTWALAHPPGDKDWWGSVNGWEDGNDEHALWTKPGAEDDKQAVHDYYVKQGWCPSALRFDEHGNILTNAKPATWVMIQEARRCPASSSM